MRPGVPVRPRELGELGTGGVDLRHPGLGEISMPHLVLRLADDPDVKVVAFRLETDEQKALVTELVEALSG